MVMDSCVQNYVGTVNLERARGGRHGADGPATVRHRVLDGTFPAPAPARLGSKAKGWRREELVNWANRLTT